MTKETATQTAAIVAYCSASIFMTLINKFTLSAFTLHPVFLILSTQAFITVALMWIGDALKLIEFRRWNRVDAKAWLPINVGMVVMLYTGGKSLQYLSVPLFTIVKNLTIILVAYLEAQFFPATTPPPSRLMLLSFFLMVFSSAIGSLSDLEISYHLEGYVWMALNCLSSAWFVLLMRKVVKNVDFRDIDTVYYNNVGTWWMFLILSWALEDWNGIYNFYSEDSNRTELLQFVQSMVISGCSAFAIGYASAWCLRVTNSTTYSMTGALNKLPVAVAGMIFFGGDITVGGVSSVLLGFGAGLMYTYGKIQQKKKLVQTVLPQTVMKSSHIRET